MRKNDIFQGWKICTALNYVYLFPVIKIIAWAYVNILTNRYSKINFEFKRAGNPKLS